MAVGLEHAPHVELLAELEQQLVLVGSVDQHGLAGVPALDHEHVVVDRPDDNAMNFDVGVRPVRRVGGGSHAFSFASFVCPMTCARAGYASACWSAVTERARFDRRRKYANTPNATTITRMSIAKA